VRLSQLGRQDQPVEMQFSTPDEWSRHLFVALCRRYGVRPATIIANGARRSWCVFREALSIWFCGRSFRTSIKP
jgi:hypothetical protein